MGGGSHMIKMGIEHEFVFKDSDGNYLDFENAEYLVFQEIVDAFPYFENDDAFFECKSLEKKPKRCYVEGFERYDLNGKLVETTPKGLEIRTLPHTTVDAVIEDFTNSYIQAMKIAAQFGLSPLLTCWHPYKTSVTFSKPLNSTELELRTDEELDRAMQAFFSSGIHVNVSISDYSKEQMVDIVQKVNYYAPFIIPFSFSSPFYNSIKFEGLSYRNYYLYSDKWQIIQLRNRKGIDILEFRGFDACGDAVLLRSLLLLFKGLLLDTTLIKRASSQDAGLLKLSAFKGFENDTIRQEGLIVLKAAKAALKDEGRALELLEKMLLINDSYAKRMKQTYQKTGDIMQSISNKYNYHQ